MTRTDPCSAFSIFGIDGLLSGYQVDCLAGMDQAGSGVSLLQNTLPHGMGIGKIPLR